MAAAGLPRGVTLGNFQYLVGFFCGASGAFWSTIENLTEILVVKKTFFLNIGENSFQNKK